MVGTMIQMDGWPVKINGSPPLWRGALFIRDSRAAVPGVTRTKRAGAASCSPSGVLGIPLQRGVIMPPAAQRLEFTGEVVPVHFDDGVGRRLALLGGQPQL